MSESKDFTNFLISNDSSNDQQTKLMKHINSSLNSQLHEQNISQNGISSIIPTFWKEKIAAFISPFALSLITGPLSTVSILLQVTQKPIVNTLDFKTKNQTGGMLKLIEQGALGDNIIYKATRINNYNDAFKKLGKQGVRGFYKGVFTGLLLGSLNSKIKAESYQFATLQNNENQLKTNVFAIGISTLADFLTLPLIFCQSRLVLQNSLPNFRTYRHFWSILRKTSIKMWFAGSSLLVVKNTISTLSWIQLIKESPVYSFIISTILSHFVTYPFLTIIRNLQCNDLTAPMMQRRKQTIRQCISRINQNGGLKAFYRGFFAYGLVHTFLGSMMIEMNLRSGYFDMME